VRQLTHHITWEVAPTTRCTVPRMLLVIDDIPVTRFFPPACGF